MNRKITLRQVWKKFQKAVEANGFLFIDATDEFKQKVYKGFMEEYEKWPLTVEEFAEDYMDNFKKTPMRSIDNTKAMNSTS